MVLVSAGAVVLHRGQPLSCVYAQQRCWTYVVVLDTVTTVVTGTPVTLTELSVGVRHLGLLRVLCIRCGLDDCDGAGRRLCGHGPCMLGRVVLGAIRGRWRIVPQRACYRSIRTRTGRWWSRKRNSSRLCDERQNAQPQESHHHVGWFRPTNKALKVGSEKDVLGYPAVPQGEGTSLYALRNAAQT